MFPNFSAVNSTLNGVLISLFISYVTPTPPILAIPVLYRTLIPCPTWHMALGHSKSFIIEKLFGLFSCSIELIGLNVIL